MDRHDLLIERFTSTAVNELGLAVLGNLASFK